MKKNDKNKLDLFLSGISSRLESNKDYFIEIEMHFKSGTKTFSAKVLPSENAFIFNFNGEKLNLSKIEIFERFINEAEKYEQSEFVYFERGAVINISITPRGVFMKQGEPSEPKAPSSSAPLSKREYLISQTKAQALLKVIGILTKDGKIKNDMIRKYNQIDHYVELISPMFESCTDDEILLLDCACGKSYLSFVMNYYLRDVLKKKCRVIAVDYSEIVIEKSKEMAKELGYFNMEFIKADLNEYIPPKNVTALISLHACDTATDLALGVAIKSQAKYIACVPCCHKELLEQFKLDNLNPILKHGIFKARINDILTDGLRTLRLEAEGYKVSAIEYISPLDTPKNLLIRAEKTSSVNEKAKNEYISLTKQLKTTSTLDKLCGLF